METWMKPRPDVLTDATVDPTVGGTFRIVMRTNGRVEVHDGTFTQIDRPHRLRFTWSSRPAGTDTVVEISCLAWPDGHTMLLLKHDGLKSEAAADNHREAWRHILSRLTELLETRPASRQTAPARH
jgi:uncharacterized protein YndB with AHSA1/START domain